jgi:GNAT superfamily N-acetyltransferase
MKNLERWGAGIVGDKRPDSVLELTLGGVAVSRAELFRRECVLEGVGPLVLGGVGGVWTASAHRRQGTATALLQQSLALFRRRGYEGGILFSLEATVPFYQTRDWQRHLGPVTMHQPGPGGAEPWSAVPVPDHVAVLTRGFTWLDEEARLEILGLPW